MRKDLRKSALNISSKAVIDRKLMNSSYSVKNNLDKDFRKQANKTTLLKSCLLNIILCQQIGCGFFDSANINIYDLVFLKPSLKIKYINGIRKNKPIILPKNL